MAQCKCIRCGKEYQCGCNAIHGLCPDCNCPLHYDLLEDEALEEEEEEK